MTHSHTPTPPHPIQLGLPIFLLTFAVYAALVPWVVRVWARTGDEPHYLLAAHSLAYDGDFDLGNNYAERDYLSFYGDANLNPHTRPGLDGQAVLTHNLGLSLLITPGYRFGSLAGVEYFFAVLGALLAANVFLLGYELTHNWLAAVAGWLAISFTPPMVWYVFLIYPEMVAGLCIIYSVRHLLNNSMTASRDRRRTTDEPSSFRPLSSVSRSGPLSFVISSFAIALLPWLSSRYLPVFALIVGWAGWRALKGRSRGWLFVALGGLAGLGTYALFSLWLYGSASPAASYAGPVPLTVKESFALVRFMRGIFGWLTDNQRGLLVSAPIYIAALWGSGLLLRRQPFVGAGVLAPFAITLFTVALWGGFWIGWEYSARFLVAVLPPLGAGVAYLWAVGRRLVVIPLTATLFGLSVMFGRAVIQQPLEGLLSSPVEMLKPQLNLESLIPAMGRYAFITAGTEAAVGEAGEAGWWHVPAGQGGIALRKVSVPEFNFGWYTARLPIKVQGVAPDTPIARVKIFSPRGGDYFSRTVLAGDLPADGVFKFDFASPLYDGWAFPPTVMVSATGQAGLSFGTLSMEPQPFHSLTLPALWLIALALIGLLITTQAGEPRLLGFAPPPAVSAAFAVVALLSLGWSLRPQPRVYAAVDVGRTVGLVVGDPLAYRGKAMEARPEAGHEAGMLAATLPEIYSPGRYRLTLSVRAQSAADPSLSLANVRVLAAGSAPAANRWEVRGADLLADGQYHRLTFEFDNPQRQALIFVLNYPATVGLRADMLIVEPMP